LLFDITAQKLIYVLKLIHMARYMGFSWIRVTDSNCAATNCITDAVFLAFAELLVIYDLQLVGWQEGHLPCKTTLPAVSTGMPFSHFGDLWRSLANPVNYGKYLL